jgi:hypothetical protein
VPAIPVRSGCGRPPTGEDLVIQRIIEDCVRCDEQVRHTALEEPADALRSHHRARHAQHALPPRRIGDLHQGFDPVERHNYDSGSSVAHEGGDGTFVRRHRV